MAVFDNATLVRKQALTCTEAEMNAFPNKVLAENEKIFVRMNDGTVRLKLGDGYTSVKYLPYVMAGERIFIRYSANEDGTDYTADWGSGKSYIGIVVSMEEPTNKEAFTWQRISELVNVVQTAGDSETLVMSQKSVTELVGAELGKNLFNKNDPEIVYESKLNVDGGIDTIKTGNYPTTDYYVSGYIPVEDRKTYAITKAISVYYSAFYDADKSLIKTINNTYINGNKDENGNDKVVYTVTIPDGVSYMRITGKTADIYIQQVEEGNTITDYEEYGYQAPTKNLQKRVTKLEDDVDELKKKSDEPKIEIVHTAGDSEDKVMSQKSVTELVGAEFGKNLFNKNDPELMIADDRSWNVQDDGSLIANTTECVYYASGYIPVKPSTTYSMKPCTAKGYCAFYGSNKEFISSIEQGTANSNGYKLTTPEGACYMRINGRIESIDTQMVAEGTEGAKLVYEPYGYTSPLPSLKEDVETLKSDLEAVENRAKTLETDVEALKNDVSECIDTNVSNYEINSGELIDTLSDLTGWKTSIYPSANNPSTVTENTRISKCGKSAKFRVLSAGGSVKLYKKFATPLDFSQKKKTFTFWVYLPKTYQNCSITVRLNNGTTYYETITAQAQVYTNTMYRGWQKVALDEQDFTVKDGFDWANITHIILDCVSGSSVSDFTVYINDLRIGATWVPKIIFRFDDALKGVYTNAEPALRARGMSGVVYCNTYFNTKADNGETADFASDGKAYTIACNEAYCTTDELREMYENGFDISNHSHSHLVFVDENAHYDYEDTDDSETKRTSVLRQIRKGQNWLINNGFVNSARHFAVPGGHDTVLCQEALKDCGTLTSGNSVHDHFVPTNNPLKIPAWGIANTTTVEQIKTWITNAVVRGRTVVLMFHDVLDTLADLSEGGYSEIRYQYLTSDFEAILDWIVAQGWAEYVVSMSEWYDGLNR